jgi:hypothetical protein
MDKKLGSNNPYEAFFSAPAVKTSQVDHKTTHLFSSLNPEITHSRKSYHRIQSSKYGSFFELIKPLSKP